MYGIIGSASGQAEPARGRMHCVIIAAEHCGQSAVPSLRVDQVGPVAHRPVVADRADHRHVCAPRRVNRRQRRQHVLAVDDVNPLARDDRRQEIAEQHSQPFVLEVVAHERHRWRGSPELDHAQAVVRGVVRAGFHAGPGLNDEDFVASVPQLPCELVRAPPGAAAHGRKCIGDQQDPHDGRGGPARQSGSKAPHRAVERLAVRAPTVLANRALAGRPTKPLTQRRVLQAIERVRECRRAYRRARPRVASDTSIGRRPARGATTGRPEDMYSKIFSGDQ